VVAQKRYLHCTLFLIIKIRGKLSDFWENFLYFWGKFVRFWDAFLFFWERFSIFGGIFL
jgi:hypothetical protein